MELSLQIKDIRLFKANSEISQRIADATHDISQIKFYITEIELEDGTLGQGYLLAFHYFPKAVEGAFNDMVDFFRQYKVYETVRMAEDFKRESEYFGEQGLLKWIMAAVNIAMWDAWGNVNRQPIWKLLGSAISKVPVYGSGGWLSYSDKELLDEVKSYKSRGFRAVKIKVGSPEKGRDLHRLKIVREALGNDIQIMMDANQGLDVSEALNLTNVAQALNIHWFEEPVHRLDYDGYKTLRSKTAISLAMGEREYDMESLKNLIERNAIDLWQPDILRIGGVEGWRESAALAKAYNLKVLPHYYKDYDIPLLCTISNGYGAESFDWIDDLIDNQIKIDNGMAFPRESPGWGFKFLYDKMQQI